MSLGLISAQYNAEVEGGDAENEGHHAAVHSWGATHISVFVNAPP